MADTWFTFKVEDPAKMYLAFAYHLSEEYGAEYCPNILGTYNANDENDKDIEKIRFGIQDGITKFMYEEIPFNVEMEKCYPPKFNGNKLAMWTNLNIGIFISTRSKAIKTLEKFIRDAIKYIEDAPKNQIRIFRYNGNWQQINRLEKRPLDTIYLNPKEKQKIKDDVNQFIADKSDYVKFGIPYKRNYMFYGPPGSGKTSFIFAIASMLGRDIFNINLSAFPEENKLLSAISEVNLDSILVFEDIDAIFVNRESSGKVSLSTILNILDGLCYRNGCITFLTANHISTLDAALLRPGRIDFKMEFTNASQEQVKQMFEKIVPNCLAEFDEFYSIIGDHKINMSLIQKFLFEHRKSTSVLQFKKELRSLIGQYEMKDSGVYV